MKHTTSENYKKKIIRRVKTRWFFLIFDKSAAEWLEVIDSHQEKGMLNWN